MNFERRGLPVERTSFIACLATVLELDPDEIPRAGPEEDPAVGWTTSRWLGGRGLGIASVAEPASFSWPGPWIGRLASSRDPERRHVVMFGVPSGIVWDPAGGPPLEASTIEAGFILAPTDVAQVIGGPTPPTPPGAGRVSGIWVAERAAAPARSLERVRALPGRGLEGDRHVSGEGTFPSGLPGSALTLIEDEVCRSFDPPLAPDEHRRNLITAGIDLNALVGHEFTIGAVRCRGMRLCEPCRVAQGYSERPILRSLVHRGGLRADILDAGEIAVGAEIRAVTAR